MPWKNAQKAVVKAYQRYAGMPDQVYRAKLREHTGATSSTDISLGQFAFDHFMPVMEIAAHLAEINGRTVGNRPRCIRNWYHWRKRCPGRGKANTRHLWKVRRLWDLLRPHLDPEHQAEPADADPPYLLQIAGQANHRFIPALHDLTITEARLLIEALKDRLSHTHARNTAGATPLPMER